MGCSSSKAPPPKPNAGKQKDGVDLLAEQKRMWPGKELTWKMLRSVGIMHMPQDSYSPELNGGPIRFKALSEARVGVCTIDGAQKEGEALKYKTNQDFGLLRHPLVRDDPGQLLVGVFDGHGLCGEVSSHFAGITISEEVASALASGKGVDEALIEGIQKAQALLKSKMPGPVYTHGGTTAVVAHLDTKGSKLTVAHVGDARLVTAVDGMSGWVVGEGTDDHKPNDAAEKVRIESFGGIVKETVLSDGSGSIFRVAASDPNDPKASGLAVARSLGDGAYKELGVVADATITHIDVTTAHRCVVLASDGLFEFMSNEEAVSIASRFRSNASLAAEQLTHAAAKLWTEKSPPYRDDITAAVIFLPVDAETDASSPAGAAALTNGGDVNSLQFTTDNRVSTDDRLTIGHDPHLRGAQPPIGDMEA